MMSGGVIIVNSYGTPRSQPEAELLSPTQQSSQQHSVISSQDLDNLLSAFFKTLLTSEALPPYLDKIDPSKLTLGHIQQICWRIYFDFLQVNYDLHGVGGACSFIPEHILQVSKQNAFNQAVRHCEMLVKITTCPQLQTELEQKYVIDQLRTSLNAIGSSLDVKNAERRNQYISKNQNSVMNRFQQTLKIRYNLMYQENGQPKFYKPQTMNQFVTDVINEAFQACDAFVKHLTPTNQGQVAERFDFTKKSIQKYGSDLISKNLKNSRIVNANLNDIISKQFEANCLTVIQERSFLTKNEIKEIVKEQKDKCFQQITNIYHESMVENCPESRSYFERKLNEKEKLVLISSLKLARTEDKDALKTYFERIESKIGIKDISVWLRAEAKESRVHDCHVAIVQNALLEAFQKCREKCDGTVPDFDDDAVTVEKQIIGMERPTPVSAKAPVAQVGPSRVISISSPPPAMENSSKKHKISSSTSPSISTDPRLNGDGKRGRIA